MNSTDSEWREHADAEDLERVAREAACVLLDFDGPVCRLFANHPAAAVAARLRALADSRGHLLSVEGSRDDPHRVLHAVAATESPELVAAAETLLTADEVLAARTATPTPHAAELVGDLARMGIPLAVTTNNSAEAVHAYLRRSGLDGPFTGHVHGREPGRPHLMKPDPHCLRQALASHGVPPGATVMLGDSASDVVAARAAGVTFVGYARDARKTGELQNAGARLIVESLGALRAALAGRRFG